MVYLNTLALRRSGLPSDIMASTHNANDDPLADERQKAAYNLLLSFEGMIKAELYNILQHFDHHMEEIKKQRNQGHKMIRKILAVTSIATCLVASQAKDNTNSDEVFCAALKSVAPGVAEVAVDSYALTNSLHDIKCEQIPSEELKQIIESNGIYPLLLVTHNRFGSADYKCGKNSYHKIIEEAKRTNAKTTQQIEAIITTTFSTPSPDDSCSAR